MATAAAGPLISGAGAGQQQPLQEEPQPEAAQLREEARPPYLCTSHPCACPDR